MWFPADKKRILLFLQKGTNTEANYKQMVALLNIVEDRQYQNVFDVTKAAGLVEWYSYTTGTAATGTSTCNTG
jgi:hypothetical protein